MPPKVISKVPQKKAPQKKAFRPQDYATLTIPIEQVKDIKMAFDIFDGDLSGIVDPQELKEAFINLGFGGQNKFVYQILAELDQDQSGGIDFAQFQDQLLLKQAKKTGKITVLQLKKVAQDLGQDLTDEQIQKMFIKADLDDDGFVTSDDFYNIMTHRVYWDQ